jgi:hypothetical protein
MKTKGDIGNESNKRFAEKHQKIKSEQEKKSPSKPVKKTDPLKSKSHIEMMERIKKTNPYK